MFAYKSTQFQQVVTRKACVLICERIQYILQGSYRQWKASENSVGSEKSAKLGSQWSQRIWLVGSENDKRELNSIPKLCKMYGPQINMLLTTLAKGTVFTIHTVSQFRLWNLQLSLWIRCHFIYRRMEKMMWSLILAKYYCLFSGNMIMAKKCACFLLYGRYQC